MVSIFDKIQQLKRNKILKMMAAQEFEQARGNQHLQLLISAREKFNVKIKSLRGKISQLEAKRQQIETTTHEDLRKKLEYHIVSTKIFEVPGIGKTLGESITRYIFNGKLTDLRYASRLQGIGESKQYAINNWIRKYEKEIPRRIKQDFPGKSKLLLVAAKRIFIINEEIEKLQDRKTTLEEKLNLIQPWIDKFGKVSQEDFVNARLDRQNNHEEIVLFINGIYGEWEPIPEWFTDVLNEANNV